jgi:hypothetical protein
MITDVDMEEQTPTVAVPIKKVLKNPNASGP